MSSVWIFFSASAAARLTAVVVLPTPPFWLAMVKMVVGMKRSSDGRRRSNDTLRSADLLKRLGTRRVDWKRTAKKDLPPRREAFNPKLRNPKLKNTKSVR